MVEPKPRQGQAAPERGRRRSERAHRAIITSAQELLEEVGYGPLSIEGVAARAGVGKQTIYRWWRSKAALVVEAYLAHMLEVSSPPDTGSTREDVREVLLRRLVAPLAHPPARRVVAGVVADLQHDPELGEGFRRDVVPAGRQPMLDILERGRQRGEIRADVDLELAVDALHGAVFYRLLLSHSPLDAAFAGRLADQVLDGLAASSPRRRRTKQGSDTPSSARHED